MICQFCEKEDMFLNFDNTCCHCGKKQLNSLQLSYENILVQLIIKAKHVPLNPTEDATFSTVWDYLELEACDNCEGQGGKEFPSPHGGAWEWCSCKKCSGSGILNTSEHLQKLLNELN
jgi:hypothetical protein